jgi:ParB family chromosome partitioning protein
MAFNILDLMNNQTRAAVEGVENYEEIKLDLEQIRITKHNRYSMDELEELATSILMDGLQEPLILGRVNGEFLLSGGHRRAAALNILKSEGHEEITHAVPCRFKDMTEIQFRISLLVGNTFNRKMTDYDLMNQTADWKEVLTQARKEKLLVLESGKRVRDYVAQILGESTTKIAQLEAINNNAVPEVKEQFANGNMGITSTYEASKLSEDAQKGIAAAVEEGADVKSEEIKAIAEEGKKKRKTKEDEAKEQSVSDTDTTEEEKANSRKLHAVKMIEKYYIYLSQEETEILERMLEDCKRRKREYALPEEG